MENSYQVSLLHDISMLIIYLSINFRIYYVLEADEDEKRSENFEKNSVSMF